MIMNIIEEERINNADFATAYQNWVLTTRKVQADIERICIEIDAILTDSKMDAGWERIKLPWGYSLSIGRYIGVSHGYLHQSTYKIDTNPEANDTVLDEYAVRMLVADIHDGYIDEVRNWAKLPKKARAAMVSLGRETRIRSDIAIGILDAADYEDYNFDGGGDE